MYYFANPAAGVYNELQAGGATWDSYVVGGGHIAAETFTTGGTPTTYYFVQDQLGSTTVLTNTSGTLTEYDSYDAWGYRRAADGQGNVTECGAIHPLHVSLRGYTAQEEMDSLCLVNLNARLYDPALGRALSADPTVPGATNGQAFNRYAYVTNNPLSLIDPTGYGGDGPCGNGSVISCGSQQPPCPNNCPGGQPPPPPPPPQTQWQGGMCITCDYPAYIGWDATMFIPGFTGGVPAGAGGVGNGAHLGSISGDEEAAGSYDAPYSSLWGAPYPGISGYYQLYGVAVQDVNGSVGPTNWGQMFIQTGGGLNGWGYTDPPGDNTLLARVMFAEAAGYPNAYPPVGWSIVNRVGAPGFPKTLSGVIYQQDSNGNYEFNGVGSPLWNEAGDPSDLTGPNAASYAQALTVANGILDGTIPDPTGGAEYFYSSQSGAPPGGFFANDLASGRLVTTYEVPPYYFLMDR